MANVARLRQIDRVAREFREANPIAIDADRFGYLFLSGDDEAELREYGERDHIENFENGWLYRGLQVFFTDKLKPGQVVLSVDRFVMRKPPYAPPPGAGAH